MPSNFMGIVVCVREDNARKKNMRNIFIIIGLACIVLFGFLVVASTSRKSFNSEKKLTVVTTLFPLYDFARMIGGDFATVSLLLPPGMEAHSFEPKPSDIVRINASDIFIYTGKYMEPWAEDVIKSSGKENIKIVDASTDISLVSGVARDDDKSVGTDPHIWLDFENDKHIIHTITEAFVERDPLHTAYYRNREEDYVEKFTILDNEYRLSLEDCKTRDVVYGGHFAFGYLMKRYHLNYFSAQGISPDAEPTAKDLISLVEQIKKENILYVFYEELTSPKIAETIASETGAKLLLLNAGHNISKEDFDRGVSFLSIMEENKSNLIQGLQCQ